MCLLAHPGSDISDLEQAMLIEAVQSVWTDKGRQGKSLMWLPAENGQKQWLLSWCCCCLLLRWAGLMAGLLWWLFTEPKTDYACLR